VFKNARKINMSANSIYRLIFVAFIIGLTIFKWNHIRLPYFADELAFYAKAANYQAQHGISLMPGSVPDWLTRGHPLFFIAMTACVLKFVANAAPVAHFFCFLISITLLCAVYVKISRYFNPLTGLVSALIVGVQPLFLAQCCLLLPEITLSLLIFMALCAYYENRFFLFALYASLGILTKETAAVLPIAVLLYDFFLWALTRHRPQSFYASGILSILAPYLVLVIFLMLQKKQNGWYLFPHHTEMIDFTIQGYLYRFKYYFLFFFQSQGRLLLTAILFVASILAIMRHQHSRQNLAKSFLLLLVIFSILFIALTCSFDFLLSRYVAAVLAPFCILAAMALTTISNNKYFIAAAVILVFAFAYNNLEGGTYNSDGDLGYIRQIKVLQQAIDYVYETAKPGEGVDGNPPVPTALYFPGSGYLKGKKVRKDWQSKTGNYFLILREPGLDYNTDSIKNQMSLLKSFDDGNAHARVYYVTHR
jgi:hypothetical protein